MHEYSGNLPGYRVEGPLLPIYRFFMSSLLKLYGESTAFLFDNCCPELSYWAPLPEKLSRTICTTVSAPPIAGLRYSPPQRRVLYRSSFSPPFPCPLQRNPF